MSNRKPKVGDEVEVTFTGTVVSAERGCIEVRRPNRDTAYLDTDDLKVKVLKREHEPEYREGLMYLDANGHYWQYAGDHTWYTPDSIETYYFDVPVRPLRRLVPEGDCDG